MKKVLKPLLISIAALLILVIGAASFLIWFIFTPERISPLVNRQAQEYFSVPVDIQQVELTFFSTFPRFGLRLDSVLVVNPGLGAQSDTVVHVGKITGAIDIMSLWRKNQVILSDIKIENAGLNAYIGKDGITNFDIILPQSPDDTLQKPESGSSLIDLEDLTLENVSITFIDDSLMMASHVIGLNGHILALMDDDRIKSKIELGATSVYYRDSAEVYLNNIPFSLSAPVEIIPSSQEITLGESQITLGEFTLALKGWTQIKPETGDILTDLTYGFQNWQISHILSMVPQSFHSYWEGMLFDGLLSSNGTVAGVFNDSVFPLMDVQIQLANMDFQSDKLPFPLSDLNGDVKVYTDLINSEISYAEVITLTGKTPESSFSLQGLFTHLLGDIRCNLTANADLLLDEMKPLIPDSLQLELTGRMAGAIGGEFNLSNLEKMELEKMNLNGDFKLDNFRVLFDSIWATTPNSSFSFSLPAAGATYPGAGFLSASLSGKTLRGGIIGDHSAYFSGARFAIHTSDVRDTTRIPSVHLNFLMDSLYAGNDTLKLALQQPSGTLRMIPVDGKPDHPHLTIAYQGNRMEASLDQTRAIVGQLKVNADVINDKSQDDIFLQWVANGDMDMKEGEISMPELGYPLQIPTIQLGFNPDTFDVTDSRLIIDRSDFQLTGMLHNVLSYFRGDSLLRGNFKFVSVHTDVEQLMNLTNGIGYENDTLSGSGNDSIMADDVEAENSGPYMVPRGMDIILTTDVDMATFGKDTATAISGDVRLNDGILVLGALDFTTPAARMRATAMYKTPRKNHLYLGLDYKMLDIEIEELLQMIPDIDTLMPMLRSFRGKGEFHMAIESYLDSTYTVKKSTLRGAASISGQNLVLMDGETFSEIAKTLFFTKKAENVVDSLSAEFTIFREEIDVYPFMIVMDRYKAVVGGRHNLDMSFKYNISVIESPLPMRLGIEVKGNLDDISYKPQAVEYPEFFRPVSRRAVHANQLDLRKLIRESLMDDAFIKDPEIEPVMLD